MWESSESIQEMHGLNALVEHFVNRDTFQHAPSSSRHPLLIDHKIADRDARLQLAMRPRMIGEESRIPGSDSISATAEFRTVMQPNQDCIEGVEIADGGDVARVVGLDLPIHHLAGCQRPNGYLMIA